MNIEVSLDKEAANFSEITVSVYEKKQDNKPRETLNLIVTAYHLLQKTKLLLKK
jgi:hypothetical protein